MPNPDSMPVPSSGHYHLFAPDPANKTVCYFCGDTLAQHAPT